MKGHISDDTESFERPTWVNNARREGFYGWKGLGGSVFQWHPELKIGFSYIPTDLNSHDWGNIRAGELQ